MNWNPVKQFLKPDLRKISLAIIFALPVLIFLIIAIVFDGCDCPKCLGRIVFWNCCPVCDDLTLIEEIGNLYFNISNLPLNIVYSLPEYPINLILIIIIPLYWYLLSCLIVWVYDKYKKK